MNRLKNTAILVLALMLISAAPAGEDFSRGRYNNVCKDLRDDVLLYFVFIDTRTTYPWTEFDILTTIDSIQVARRWLEAEAASAGISLKIKTDYYIGNEYATISRSLPRKTVLESVTDPNYKKGTLSLSKWADYVSKEIGASLYIKEKDGIPPQKKPGNKERLVAYLRDEYNVESVALLFFVNNYFRNDISIAVNTLQTDDIEFAVVSYKYPSEIVHNFLHLFGATDLYKSEQRKSPRRIRLAKEYFPDDVMQDPYARSLEELDIGAFTRYMIGWSNELDEEFDPLLNDGLF
jgi:hypothetical protein